MNVDLELDCSIIKQTTNYKPIERYLLISHGAKQVNHKLLWSLTTYRETEILIFRLASHRLLFSLASILTPWTLRFQVVIGYLGGVINLILFLSFGDFVVNTKRQESFELLCKVIHLYRIRKLQPQSPLK